ncbi:hypothetical protein D9M68_945420 [compost metagenome]
MVFGLGTPVLRHAGTPVAEGAGGDTVQVKHIPACVVAASAGGTEAVELAVAVDDRRRREARVFHQGAELIFGVHCEPPICARNARAASSVGRNLIMPQRVA